MKGYGIGTGAALFKHVRLGDPLAALVYLRVLGRTAWYVGGRVATFKRPTGAGFLLAFLEGPIASYRFRVNRPQRQFVDR